MTDGGTIKRQTGLDTLSSGETLFAYAGAGITYLPAGGNSTTLLIIAFT